MVKRWGKSPPRTGQPGRYGKPHPEQCRIGASRGLVTGASPRYRRRDLQPRGPGWQLDRLGNKRDRGMVIQGGNPGTEPGLQAIRTIPIKRSSPLAGVCKPLLRPFRRRGERGRFAEDIWAELKAVFSFWLKYPRPEGKRPVRAYSLRASALLDCGQMQ